MDDMWIVVPNWSRFQHYKDRDPTWIKVYANLNSDDKWCRLSASQRGLLVSVWVEYARADGVLRVPRMRDVMGQACDRYGNFTKQLESLNHAGLIELSASKPLALRYQRASPRREEKRKEEQAAPSAVENPKPKNPERVPFNGPPAPSRVNMPPSDEVAYVRKLVERRIINEPFEMDMYTGIPADVREELRARIIELAHG